MSQELSNHRPYQYPQDLGAALALIRDSDTWWAEKYCLIFMAFTITGSHQATLATWNEIDWQGAIWHIPANHTSDGIPKDVPLASQAIEILDFAKQCSKDEALIFPPEHDTRSISHRELTDLMDKMNIPLYFNRNGLLFDIPGTQTRR